MTTSKIPPAPKWDLESIFTGGSKSADFKKFRDQVKSDVEKLTSEIESLPKKIEKTNVDVWTGFMTGLQDICADIEMILAFSGCLMAQKTDDSDAYTIEAEGYLYLSQFQKITTRLEALALEQSDDQWQLLTGHEKTKGVAFWLDELRKIAKSKMPVEKESLALELAVDGYHAWGRLYTKMAGELKVSFEEDGKTDEISLGQLATKFSSEDRSVRAQAFKKLTEAWESRAELAAMALNSQAGFRLALYKNRDWKSPLYEPLVMTRMKQETLEAMWRVVEQETPKLKRYIDAKKKLLGIDKFTWYDEFAPCGKADKLLTFKEAGKFIVDNVKPFSADMADFVTMALQKRWVEAEDRPGKAGGAFCTGLGQTRQSRVFMTYAGTFENLLTLAHELGHAYHQYVLAKKPFFATDYPMNLAETASIFSETLVLDAALAQATDPQEKLMLLEQKLQAAYVMFCDLHSRYLFDNAFYGERTNGVVGKDRLNELMIEAQKRAFAGMLDESGYHPLFWSSKMHFYITDAPYYNYPYTFGYLFAGGVYDRARKEGGTFADKYRDLLSDTGSMTSEQVAQKHLGVDLTGEEFWKDAVGRALIDVDEFVKLAETA